MTRFARLILIATLLALPVAAGVPLLHSQAAVSALHARATVNIVIQNFAFSPASVTIAPGTTVVWTQKDSAPHTVTSDTGAWTASAELSPGQTFSHTFTTPGTYSYHCAVHPNMTAQIIVSAAAGTGSGQGSKQGTAMGHMGPMSKTSMPAWTGYYDDHRVLYLSTDTSNKAEAARDGINYAPTLAKALPNANSLYVITNGAYASRGPVFGSEPGEKDYTPLWQEVIVTWKDPKAAVALGSDNEINSLEAKGKLTLSMTGTVLNCPIIKVLSGAM